MVVVESAVMFFEVIFLYRELIDAVTPWIAQQSGGQVQLGIVATLMLGTFGWLGVRGMSWFLFGRYGTPALIAVLARETISREGANVDMAPPRQPDFWRAPITALTRASGLIVTTIWASGAGGEPCTSCACS